ncbi:MAG TPA: hypothetical protein VHJ20_07580 [Polyangia bacterium]|nr:hypothetical protein [Polyangia bacterium]
MRSVSSFSLRACVAAFPLVMLACNSQPIDPATLAAQAALNAREIVHQSGGGVAFTQSDDSGLHKIMDGLVNANHGLAGMMPVSMPAAMSAMSTTAMAQAAAGMPTLSTTEEQFDDTADDLKVFIRDRLLADANVESKTADEVVYLLKGDPTCRSLPKADDLPDAVQTLDQSCVDQLTKMPVRIAMRADGDGVRLTIQLGPDKLELITFIIHSNAIAVEVDFAKAYAASNYADQTLGDGGPMGSTQFEKLAGAMRVSLEKEGEKHVTFSAAVIGAIDVAEKQADGTLGTEVKLAVSDPLWSLEADGVAKTAKVTVDEGALDVLTTWDPQGTGVANRDLHVALGGITGTTTFTEGVQELVSKGIGIGATSISVRGQSIFDLGLNPHDMNRFDLRITVDSANEPHFEITPRFALTVGTHFKNIANDYAVDDQPPSYLLDQTYSVDLENGGGTAKVEVVPGSGSFTGGLEIDAGSLTISSDKVAQPVSVPTGMCLTGVSNPPADANPILGAFTSVSCPQ